jgi:hypothetical protein
MMTKKVLVVVNGGVASAYAEYGVEVVCVDLDDSKVMVENDMIPIHPGFVPLMEIAGISGEWPVSVDGRMDDADHLDAKGLQQENYVASKGQRCPVCGSDLVNQQGRPLQADGGEAWADIYCFGCSASWQDHYQLVGFNGLSR